MDLDWKRFYFNLKLNNFCKWTSVGIFAFFQITGCTVNIKVGDLTGGATKLVITTSPALTGNTDTALLKQPIVTAVDSSDKQASAYQGTITFNGYSDSNCTALVASSLNSGTPTNQSGVVSFSGVKILKTNVISIKATDGTLNSSCLTGFTISPGVISSIVYSTQPSSTATSGINFVVQPVLLAKDANNNTLGAGTAITLSLPASTLACTTNPVLTNASGLAVFSGCNLTGTSGTYTLTGASGGKTVLSTNIVLTQLPSLSWNTLTNDFGTLTLGNYSNYVSFTLSNAGLGPARTCTAPTLSNTTDFTIFSDSCGTNDLAAGASCVVNVRSNPGSVGAKTATLSRSCAVGGAVSTTANGLTTNGSGTITVAWNQNAINFGNVRATSQSSTTTLYFQNLSLLTATGCTTTTNSNTTDFTVLADTCGTSNLNPFDQCSVQVKANPTTAGSKSATISRTCAGTTSTVSLTTTGLASGLSVTSLVSSEASNHTCAIMSDGSVQCWGDNNVGQLGDGTTTQRSTPTLVTGLSGVVTAIATGQYHTCALITGGTVQCWGANNYGQLGDGSTTQSNTPTSVTGLSSVTALTTGHNHSCALISGGTMKCWGYNGQGQLGDGTTFNRSSPTLVTGLSSVTALTAGSNHTCALISGGTVKCWGWNGYGELGDGTTTDRYTPSSVGGLSSVAALKAGFGHTCALITGGTLKCWGDNGFGELGDGTTTQRTSPTSVAGLSGVVTAVSSGDTFVCALISGGTVQCWGNNRDGQLGDGTLSKRIAPTTVTGLSGSVTALATGVFHSCALISGGTVQCWGYNRSGQLGDGSTTNKPNPTPVSGLSGNVTLMTAGSDYTCALITGGTVQCWGNNTFGQLGNSTYDKSNAPTSVTGLSGVVTALTAGSAHTCALISNGSIQCWGGGFNGQLGNGGPTQSSTPISVVGLSGVATALSAGNGHTCALISGGTVQCWGDNFAGQLGDGTTTQRNAPTTVSGLSGTAIGLISGSNHTCALISGGTVQCWGFNAFGQLGDGTTTDRSTPTSVSGLTGVSTVNGGSGHTCAFISGGTIKCWGYNGYGQLGDGTTTQRNSPILVSGLSGTASSMVVGQYHTCAVISGGTSQCWGDNFYGQLGDGGLVDQHAPKTIPGQFSISGVYSGALANHTCILKSGVPSCFGYNSFYQVFNSLVKSTVSGF